MGFVGVPQARLTLALLAGKRLPPGVWTCRAAQMRGQSGERCAGRRSAIGAKGRRRPPFFSVAQMRRLWGDVVFRPPSRFLRESGLGIHIGVPRMAAGDDPLEPLFHEHG
jgi:hypothetical protein